jgi:KDO2-lipid IV(A) lauroyltransferase
MRASHHSTERIRRRQGVLQDSILSSTIPWVNGLKGRLQFAPRVIRRRVGTPVGKRRKRKGRLIQLLECLPVCILLLLVRLVPLSVGPWISEHLGGILFGLMPKRRSIALENLRGAFPYSMGMDHMRMARRSFSAFVLTCFESLKFWQALKNRSTFARLVNVLGGLSEVLQGARKIHEEVKGCIFVTPHLGNWEILAHVSSIVGIPAVVVVRPLDNDYLEKLIYRKRSESGQIIIPKKNALFTLTMSLRQGKSVALLPDQGTGRGIPVPFFGREAFTSPVPAMLAVRYHRPIVVVACCRSHDARRFEGVVSGPIWPGERLSEKEEICRLTGRMNLEMEAIIRRYPEQYLWMHDRWKKYKRRRKLLTGEGFELRTPVP